jgi:hypothetical protein
VYHQLLPYVPSLYVLLGLNNKGKFRALTHTYMQSQFYIFFVVLLGFCVHLALFCVQELQDAVQVMNSEVSSWHQFDKKRKSEWDICKRTANLFSGEDEMRRALKVADEFHTEGGNLNAIQEFLDIQIQVTMENFGLKFTDKNGFCFTVPENVTIAAFPHNLLKENDIHHRGGCDQRVLPEDLVEKILL